MLVNQLERPLNTILINSLAKFASESQSIPTLQSVAVRDDILCLRDCVTIRKSNLWIELVAEHEYLRVSVVQSIKQFFRFKLQ